MKKRLPLFLMIAALCALVSDSELATVEAQKAANAPDSAEQEARIARIENGLLPAVVIKGQPAPTMTVADRMKHYHVPG
ncbi:MAG TPA: hypothetical protein VKM56_03080, partial [Verrucomicrobiae bacterium]|nr:hypothetical protein [Verrucomicrobiae bacterium]